MPVYFFLCHLSFLDLCYTTSTVPQLLVNLHGPDRTITYRGCVAQLSICLALGAPECVLLVVMALDRWAAVCHPLHYSSHHAPSSLQDPGYLLAWELHEPSDSDRPRDGHASLWPPAPEPLLLSVPGSSVLEPEVTETPREEQSPLPGAVTNLSPVYEVAEPQGCSDLYTLPATAHSTVQSPRAASAQSARVLRPIAQPVLSHCCWFASRAAGRI
ncbi:hypothetical protein CB1_000339023 [Camelus ferus]|nr:hypothetical protein CB1_000339023 [Camelus ferus]